MSGKKNISAASIIGKTVTREKWLSIGIVLTVTGAVAISLLPAEIFRDFPWRRSIFC